MFTRSSVLEGFVTVFGCMDTLFEMLCGLDTVCVPNVAGGVHNLDNSINYSLNCCMATVDSMHMYV